MNDRLEYIKNYYAAQKNKVEILPHRSTDKNGMTIIRRFTGRRAGVDFKNGVAIVDQAQLAALKELYPESTYPGLLIIHDKKEV